MSNMELVREKKKRGRPSTGGRNPANWNKEKWERKTPYITTSITGTPEEIAQLKKMAADKGLSVSRFVINNMLYGNNLTK